MNFTQPTENPNIPDELVKQITAVRNQISLGQADVLRLRELAQSSQYEINELVKQKVELIEQIANAEKSKEALNTTITELSKEVETLGHTKEDITDYIAKVEEEIIDRQEELDEAEADMIIEKSRLNNEISDLNDAVKIHAEEKAAFEERVKKLNDALN